MRSPHCIVCLIETALSGLYMLGAEPKLLAIPTNIYLGSAFPRYATMDVGLGESGGLPGGSMIDDLTSHWREPERPRFASP